MSGQIWWLMSFTKWNIKKEIQQMNEICVQTVDRLNDDKLQLSRFKLDRWWNARHLGMDKKKSLAMPENQINKLCVIRLWQNCP